ncbi:MAG TPA: PP2C family protein-serine/threonine phosphatase [Anaeromyxobacter sp.]|nr:PP2C family protein-serine/threonine phosphatase [Anaeromyxobacter sp.]
MAASPSSAAEPYRSPPFARAEPGSVQRYQAALLHRWCGTVAMLGAVVVPLFLLLDWFTLPAQTFEWFLRCRAAVSAVLALQLLVIRLTRATRLSFLHGYLFTVLVAGGMSWMTARLGGFDSPYYVGLYLVMAANLLLPWRPLHAAWNSTLTILLYIVLNAILGGPFHEKVLLNNLFFLAAASVVTLITARVRYRLIQKEYSARTGLIAANAALERSRTQLKAARDALWGEMEVAKRIQTALLPEDRRVGPYQIAARMVTAAEVGGDYYDLIDAGDGRHWIAIGDVSGHGVESGLVMMMTQTSILSLVRENPPRTPAQVFREVNGVLWQNISRMKASRYMTLNVVRLDQEGFTLAGKHQDVLVWRRGRGVEVVANEGCWIGLVPDTGPHAPDLFVPMAAGDLALFFTDGATEARGPGGDMYGEERLAAALSRVAGLPLEDALTALFADLSTFRMGRELDDDVTLLLVRRLGEARAVRSTPARVEAQA